MTRLLVFSDTHGRFTAMEKVLHETTGIDRYIHLGDYCRDARDLELRTGRRILTVRGNNDFMDRKAEKEIILSIDGYRILLTHGHRHGVYYGHEEIVRKAKSENCDAVFYGHTHAFHMGMEEGVFFINPGSASLDRSGQGNSYGIVEISPKGMQGKQILL